MRWFTLAFLFIVAVARGAVADTGTERLDAYLLDMRSLQADFEQTLFDEKRTRMEDSRGTMYLQRPGRFRWDYFEPYPQTIVADGKNVWVYDSELAQVTVKPLDDALGNTPALLLSSGRPLGESFVVKELGLRGDLQWVELTPKSSEVNFARIRLGFAEKDLRVMELVDNFGQTTQLRFAALVKNSALDPRLFSFTPPEDVDVIGDVEER